MYKKVFIVCIDLNSMFAARNFESSLSTITSEWKKLMERVYLVSVTGEIFDSESLRNRIGQISGNCDMFIMKTSMDASWRLPSSLDNWIMQNL